MCRGASKELGSQPVGHPSCLGAWGDGAIAHRPQAGVLAEMKKTDIKGLGRGSKGATWGRGGGEGLVLRTLLSVIASSQGLAAGFSTTTTCPEATVLRNKIKYEAN